MKRKKVVFPGEGKDNRVIEFAISELQRFSSGTTAGIWSQIDTVELGLSTASLNPEKDEFELIRENNCVKVIASHARSLLFAVYTLLEECAGLRWYHAGETTVGDRVNDFSGARRYSHDFVDRGLMMETAYSVDDMLDFIDWSAKNRLNSVAFPMTRWDKFRDWLAPEIAKRDLKLVLGGHSYFRFLPAEQYFSSHPEWYALIDGKRHEKSQFCFSNHDARAVFYANVHEYLQHQPESLRLSIWPADNKFHCQCRQCSGKSFLEHYCSLMAGLQNYLRQQGMNTEVEYLAYNAALSEEMLQPPPNIEDFLQIDTFLAYWGRDYSHSIAQACSRSDQRAGEILSRWSQLHMGQPYRLRILEYYTDFWMLSSLYPPLGSIIFSDLRFYRRLGVQGIFTLGVACNYGPYTDLGYPWQWRQSFNLYLFARAAASVDVEPDAVLNRYYADYYGVYADAAREIFMFLEHALAPLSAFNVPLFRLRFVDIWKRDLIPEAGGLAENVAEWSPEQPLSEAESRRDEFCASLAAELESIDLPPANDHHGFTALLEYFDYARKKIRSIHRQLTAQQMIRDGENVAACDCLRQAIELEHSLYDEDTEICNRWLDRLAGSLTTASTISGQE